MSKVIELEREKKIDYTRQRDLYDPTSDEHKDDRVTLIGCGGIGSIAAMELSKLGVPHLTLIDPDVVEPHNIPNQWFTMSMLLKPKAASLSALCALMGSSETKPHVKKFQDVPQLVSGVVVAGLDSMKARAELWELVKGNNSVQFLLDGRLGGYNVQLYTINPHDEEDIKFYEESLYTDEDANEDPCTARAIIYVSGFMGSQIARQVEFIFSKKSYMPLGSIGVNGMVFENWVGTKSLSLEEEVADIGS